MGANSRHENALVGAFLYEVAKSMVGHREDMWFGLFSTPSPVHVDVFSRVDRQWAVWVDCDQEQAGICLGYVSNAHGA